MIEQPILIFNLTFLIFFLLISSIIDLKHLETPNYMNFGLIFVAFSFFTIYSIYTHSFNPLLYSIFGFLFMLIISLILFYLGLWGGGDVKVLLGIGALIGLSPIELKNFFNLIFNSQAFNINSIYNSMDLKGIYLLFSLIPTIIKFISLIILASLIYGLVVMAIKIVKNKKEILKEIKILLKNNKILRTSNHFFIILLFISFLLFIFCLFLINMSSQFNQLLFLLYSFSLFFIFLSLLFYIFQFLFIVEKKLFIKKIKPSELTEGDWLNKQIEVRISSSKRQNTTNKTIQNAQSLIINPNKTGLTKQEIKKLIDLEKKGKIKYVEIKQGIAYFPVFFLASLFLLIFLLI